VATVARETERKYEPAAGGTAALDAAGAVREPPPLTRHSSAAEVVLGYVRDQVATVSRYDPLVRRDKPDAVHQMRVATRRARSALQAFGGIIRSVPAK
jgi:inorganic triphosphatase YgiF